MTYATRRATGFRRSLRTRLIVASVLVEVVMLALLLGNTLRLSQRHLTHLAESRLLELEETFSIALSVPLASRDHAALRSLADRLQALRDITYLAVVDTAGQVLVASGDSPRILPPADSIVSADRPVHHAVVAIQLFGQPLGQLHYGLSTAFLVEARRELLAQGLLIAAAGILLTAAALAAITVLLTRRLEALTTASARIAQGDYQAIAPVQGNDEVSVLATAFNAMADGVRMHIDELQQKTAALQSSNEELARLAEVTAHHLQEPLRTIVSYTQLLRRKYDECMDDDTDLYIKYITDAAHRLKRLLADLQDYVSIDLSAIPEDTLADLAACLNTALSRLAQPIAAAQATVTSGPLPLVHGNAQQISKALFQVLHNAVHCRRPDRRLSISVTAEESQGTVTLAVSDNGPGLPPQQRSAVFNLFHRVSHQQKGTGVGLPMVKKIMRHHGGRVWIEDAEGGGARICMSFPRLSRPGSGS